MDLKSVCKLAHLHTIFKMAEIMTNSKFFVAVYPLNQVRYHYNYFTL